MSFTTSPAIIRPATDGTNDMLDCTGFSVFSPIPNSL